MDNLDQARASLTALFSAPSAKNEPVNKFKAWQPETRMRAYTLLLTLGRISGDDAALSKFGQLAERIGSAMEQEERAQASQEASRNMLTLSAALHRF
jgi:hypothetical protein